MVTANGSVPVGTLYQGVDKASAGYKLLASMGWKEGDGLVSAQFCVMALLWFASAWSASLCRKPFLLAGSK